MQTKDHPHHLRKTLAGLVAIATASAVFLSAHASSSPATVAAESPASPTAASPVQEAINERLILAYMLMFEVGRRPPSWQEVRSALQPGSDPRKTLAACQTLSDGPGNMPVLMNVYGDGGKVMRQGVWRSQAATANDHAPESIRELLMTRSPYTREDADLVLDNGFAEPAVRDMVMCLALTHNVLDKAARQLASATYASERALDAAIDVTLAGFADAPRFWDADSAAIIASARCRDLKLVGFEFDSGRSDFDCTSVRRQDGRVYIYGQPSLSGEAIGGKAYTATVAATRRWS
jgi:hypothetical protein